jgi:hypothetical protein
MRGGVIGGWWLLGWGSEVAVWSWRGVLLGGDWTLFSLRFGGKRSGLVFDGVTEFKAQSSKLGVWRANGMWWGFDVESGDAVW